MLLYIMLAYLMLLLLYLTLFVCMMVIFCHRLLQMLFVFILFLGLLTHSLFISNIILNHAQCFKSVGFPNFMFAQFFYVRGMCSLKE